MDDGEYLVQRARMLLHLGLQFRVLLASEGCSALGDSGLSMGFGV